MAYESKFFDKLKIQSKCYFYGIENFKISIDGSIDVEGDVNLYSKLKNDKIPIKFGVVDGYFSCDSNFLTSLKNSPIKIMGNFNCSSNKLTTLLDGPEYVKLGYYCYNNNLKDVYGFPEKYKIEKFSSLEINNNPVYEILNVVEKKSIIKFIHLLNEEHVIRNGNTLIEDRLEEVFYNMDITLKDQNLSFKNYKII